MKLSELQRYINDLRSDCNSDPTVEFEVGGSKATLTRMAMTQWPCEFSMVRGELLPLPKCSETLLIQLEATNV